MSLAEIQAYYSSPPQSAPLLRNLKKSSTKIRKSVRAVIRKAKSKSLANIRRQYFLSHAYTDLRVASRQNEDIVIMAVASIVVLAVAAAVTISEIIFSLSVSLVSVADSTGFSILSLAMLATVATAILYSWFAAFLINLQSISVLEGATRKRIRSVRLTFRKSLQQASRVACSWFMLLALITVPLGIMGIATFISLQLIRPDIYSLMTIAQYEIIVASIWVLYVLMQYSLVTYVVLFEKDQTLTTMFGRSRELVHRRGRLFVLSSYFVLAAYSTSIYLLATLIERTLSMDKWLVFGFSMLIALLVFNGVLVTFYRKRRLARKH